MGSRTRHRSPVEYLSLPRLARDHDPRGAQRGQDRGGRRRPGVDGSDHRQGHGEEGPQALLIHDDNGADGE